MNNKIKLLLFGFFAVCVFAQSVSAQECVNKLTTIGDGQMILGKFKAKATSGNAYTDGTPDTKLPNLPSVKDEMKQMAEFNSVVRGYFANSTPDIIAQTTFAFEKGEDAGNRPCRNLVAKASNGITATIFIPEIQETKGGPVVGVKVGLGHVPSGTTKATSEAKAGPVQGVKVGLSKNPPGGQPFATANPSDNQGNPTKWNIAYDQAKFVEMQKKSLQYARVSPEAFKSSLTQEFTETLNKWFPPSNSTVPTNPTKRAN